MTLTRDIRFRAFNYTWTFAPMDRYMARMPSLVEGFPNSYPAGLVERAEALITRMAAPVTEQADLDQLRADLRQFQADVEASR